MNDRIPTGTKCVIKSTPEGSVLYADLRGAFCTSSEKRGSRGIGTQFFELPGSAGQNIFDLTGRTGQGIFGNGDSGFLVEAVEG
jgi:hypothetical protein